VARATLSRTPARFVAAGTAAVLVVVLAVVLLATCGGDDKKKVSPEGSSTTTVNKPGKSVKLAIGSVDVQTWGPAVKLPKDTQKKVLALAQTYVDTAVHTPISAGTLGGQYSSIFEKGVLLSATGSDRPALTDLAVGKTSKYKETATPVKISGLADGGGSVLYLATNFSLNVKATTDGGPLTIARDVEFTFAPIGNNWRVIGYRVKAARKLAAKTTTTTAVAGKGSTP
jgi:hypothetical protein